MHVLFVADGDSKYGALNSLIQLVTELKRMNSELRITVALTRQSTRYKDFESIGCNVFRVPYTPYYQSIPCDKWKIPIKYIIRGVQYIYGRMFACSYLERKMDIKTVDLIHSNSSREDFGALLAKKYHKPFIWHIREFGDIDYPCYSYRRNYIDFMNSMATEFIAVSQAVTDHWIQKGIYADKIVRIYNGVAVNTNIKKHYPRTGDLLHFVMMGSLNQVKNQHHLIKAIALLSEKVRGKILVDIVGDGSATYTNVLKHLITANHLTDSVHLLGYRKNFYEHLANYDCGFMCSANEGFGRVTAEYMMAGLPVIASATGANPEIVEDGVNGFLYECGNIENLAEKITYLAENVEQIEKLGRVAYRTAMDRFSAKINAEKIWNQYEKISNEKVYYSFQ